MTFPLDARLRPRGRCGVNLVIAQFLIRVKYNIRRDRPIKWQGRRTSGNIEDRRRSGGTSRKSGVTGIEAVIALIIGWYFGVDVSGYVDTGNTGITTSQYAEIT